LFVFLFVKKGGLQKLIKIVKDTWLLTLIVCVVESYALIGINTAYVTGNSSVVTAIYMAMAILTVWIGVIFLKERDHVLRKIISSAFVVGGIVLLYLNK
jgi:uncharacterized membrane protein